MKKLSLKTYSALVCTLACTIALFASAYVPKRAYAAAKTYQYLAILVEFPDLTDSHLDSPDSLKVQQMIGHEGGTNIGLDEKEYPIVPMSEFFRKYSYGKVDFNWTSWPQTDDGQVVSYVAPHNFGYYRPYSASNPEGFTSSAQALERLQEITNGAIDRARPQIERTFSKEQLDLNGDNWVDSVTFFIEFPKGEGEPDPSDIFYPKTWPGGVLSQLHGMYLAPIILPVYDQTSQLSLFGYEKQSDGTLKLNGSRYSTIYHELGHQVLQYDRVRIGLDPNTEVNYVPTLKDLYRNGSGKPVYKYDIMGTNGYNQPQGYMAETLDKLGWSAEIPDLAPDTETTLVKREYKDPSEHNAVRIRVPGKDDQYFVVEYYDNKYVGQDASNRSGIYVYRVNGSKTWRQMMPDASTASWYYTLKSTMYKNLFGSVERPDEDYIYVFRPGEQKASDGTPSTYDTNMPKAVIDKTGVYGKYKADTDEAGGAWQPDTYYFYDGTNSGIVLRVSSVDDKQATFSYTYTKPKDGVDPLVRPTYTYTINHYQQHLGDDGYDLVATDTKEAKRDDTIQVSPHSYTGFEVDKNASTLEGDLVEDNQAFNVYYKRKVYTISYTGSPDDSGKLPETKELKYGASYTFPEPGKRSGYQFLGWMANDGVLNTQYFAGSTIQNVASNYTVKPLWRALSYTVKYYYRGAKPQGVRAPVDNNSYKWHDTLTFASDPAKGATIDGAINGKKGQWTFSGWKVYSGANSLNQVEGDVIVVGEWIFKEGSKPPVDQTPLTVQVAFDPANGETPSTSRQTINSQIDEPEVPQREGYQFMGWYQSKDGEETKVDFPVVADNNLKFVAHWEKLKLNYSVKHYQQNADDDNYTLVDTDELEGAYGDIELHARSYAGFTLNTDKSQLTVELHKDKTSYALYYNRDMQTVSYTSEDGVELPQNTQVRYGGEIRLAEAPVRAGYSFAGWSVSDGTQTKTYGAGEVVENVESNLQIQPTWTAIEYHTRYSWDGVVPDAAQLPADTKTYHWHDAFAVSTEMSAGDKLAGVKDGTQGSWIFDGWHIVSGVGESGVEGNIEVKGAWHFIADPIDASKLTVRVIIDAANGSDPVVSRVNVGSTIDVPEAPVRDGYLFKGWYLAGDTDAKAEFPLVADTNVTLVAHWQLIPSLRVLKDGQDIKYVRRGEHVELVAQGFTPGNTVRFELHSNPVVLGTAVAGDDTVARLELDIPDAADLGDHEVLAIDDSDDDVNASDTITVMADASEETNNPETETPEHESDNNEDSSNANSSNVDSEAALDEEATDAESSEETSDIPITSDMMLTGPVAVIVLLASVFISVALVARVRRHPRS